MKRYIKHFLLPLLLLFAGVVLLSSCIFQDKSKMYFYVLPHHNLTDENTNEVYKNIARKYPNIENIVIISPNHFENRDQVTFSSPGQYCYQGACVNGNTIINENFIDFSTTKKDGKYNITEHGVGNHFKFIAQYFPQTQVYPLVLKIQKQFSNEQLFSFLNDYDFGGTTLVVASVDFSHHTHEKIAKLHDMKTLRFLQYDEGGEIEVDCPNCLGLIKRLAVAKGKTHFHFLQRTSVDTILGGSSNYENTSHIFGEFQIEPQGENINFLDDFSKQTINYKKKPISFAVVPKIENEESMICFYSHKNRKRKPEFWHNRLWYGVDIVATEKKLKNTDTMYDELGFTDFDLRFFEKNNIPITPQKDTIVLGYIDKNILYSQALRYDTDKYGTILCDSFR